MVKEKNRDSFNFSDRVIICDYSNVIISNAITSQSDLISSSVSTELTNDENMKTDIGSDSDFDTHDLSDAENDDDDSIPADEDAADEEELSSLVKVCLNLF